MSRHWQIVVVAATLAVGGSVVSGAQATGPRVELDTQIEQAFVAIYNLDRDRALSLARDAVTAAPDRSRAHRALGTILWLDILFQRGAVTVDNYLGGLSRSQLTLPKPPPALDAEFKREVGQATSLAEARLKQQPGDTSATHDLGAALGLQASYTASVEGRVMAAFGAARRAFDLEEEVLARNPKQLDAGTIVGTYRYSVACLGVASRMVAYLAGFGGGKARGIALIESAGHATVGATEAKTALVLIYSREGRHAEAFRVLGELAAQYPRNRLFVLERGAAAIRAGRAGEAEQILTAGLAMFEHDARQKMPGERALWFYKRGSARISLNHPADAQRDLEEGLRSAPLEWVRGRLNLDLGRVADLRGQRDEAVARYRAARDIAAQNNDPGAAADAAAFLARPFAMPRG